MNAEHWHEVERLLDLLLDLDADAQQVRLDEENPDPAIRCEVESLLAAEAQALPFLEEGVVPLAAGAFAADAAPGALGREVGAYRLEEEIGHGGMSVVYRATRTDDHLRRAVALKLLRYAGGDSAEQRLRFRAECQILAALNHAHIAQVYDAGVTPEGQPYLVMEYIDGLPLTDYCDAHRLDLHARLHLFETVCQAVQHAHQRLIVHRDLKPSNILVTRNGTVKLLDFGIAKLLDAETADVPVTMPLTRTGWRLLTPEYAAPEQVRGGAITTATDVYALGVLLYELLVGHRPYDLAGKTPSEIERIICETQPHKPSTAITQVTANGADAIDAISKARSAPVDYVQQQLRGDLDTLVMKALRKEPEDRYATVSDLLDDLRRYREGLPLQARPTTAGYRVRKFIQRHRLGAAVAAGVLGLLLLFIGVLWQQQQATARERDRAQVEAEKAQEVTNFMLGLFEANRPGEAPTDTITARTLLARGVEQAAALQVQPEVQAEMLNVMGRAYHSLAVYDQAEALLEEALQVSRDRYGNDHPQVAQNLSDLAQVHRLNGRYEMADSLLHLALAIQSKWFGEKDLVIAETVWRLGKVAASLDKRTEAQALYEQALAIQRRHLPPVHPAIANSLYELSGLAWKMGNPGKAEQGYRDVLAMRRQLYGDRHPEVAIVLRSLGVFIREEGALDKAEPLLKQALEMQQTLMGRNHSLVAEAWSSLGTLYRYRREWDLAEAAHQQAADIYRVVYNEQHGSYANELNNLALIRSARGEVEEAEQLYTQALDIFRKKLGEKHGAIGTMYFNLGALVRSVDPVRAEVYFRRSLAISREIGDPAYEALDLEAVGTALHDQERFAEAEAHYREALALQQSVAADGHPAGGMLVNLGRVLIDQDRFSEADSCLERATAIYTDRLGAEEPETARATGWLGESLLRQQRFAEAEPHLLNSYAIYTALYETDHRHVQRANVRLAELYEAWGKPDQATPYRALLIDAR